MYTVTDTVIVARGSRSQDALGIHRLLMRLVIAAVSIFAWIFVFQYFEALSHSVSYALGQTAFLLALSQTVTTLAIPYAAHHLRYGARANMLFGVILASTAFFLLAIGIEEFFALESIPVLFASFAVAIGLYRAYYRIPYRVESHSMPRQREYSWGNMALAVVPFMAGYALTLSPASPIILLLAASCGLLLAAIPLLSVSEVYERYPWGYRETFHMLFDERHIRYVGRMIADGFQGVTLLFFWPLAIFILLGWSYVVLGGVLSIVLLLTPLVKDRQRALLKALRLEESVPVLMIWNASAWLLRATVAAPLTIVLVDTYHHAGTHPIGIDRIAGEQHADGGIHVDEHSALKEMGLTLGRLLACLFVALFAAYTSAAFTFLVLFVLAAFASVLSVWLHFVGGSRRAF